MTSRADHDVKSSNNISLSRRQFLKINAACAGGLVLYTSGIDYLLAGSAADSIPGAPALTGGLKKTSGPDLIKGADWYTAPDIGDGLTYTFGKGALSGSRFLTADFLLDGDTLAVFFLTLQEGADGPAFRVRFGFLNQCSARMRLPLSLVDMNRWRIDREGAWLKPQCSGQRVDLSKVDRMTFTVGRKTDAPARWCMTPIAAVAGEITRLTAPVLPKGKLLDEMGQSAIRTWPGKTKSVDELTKRIQSQRSEAPMQKWPAHCSKWGGWNNKQLEASGYFRTEFDNSRWWLVDPDGFAFWSAGIDCVRSSIDAAFGGLESTLTFKPDTNGPYAGATDRRGSSLNFLAVNFIRAFDADTWRDKWAQIALAQLKRLGFNTVGNWSDWEFARRAQFPYVRPMRFGGEGLKNIYRDFPDVYDPAFETAAARYAQQLDDTKDDPALIGYFMMNEPTWGFSQELPAVGMLLNTPTCHTRRVLADFLKKRYADNAALAAAWQTAATFDKVANGPWTLPLNDKAETDLEAFSEIMVVRFFKTLQAACRRVDPHHLNLGIRYQDVPPHWAIEGMKTFDVFSMNCYRPKIPADAVSEINQKLKMPTMIGEWHFGALDAGLPASGIGRVPTQADRGRAYRVYLEDAAANPNCVGAHWFTLYDQSAIGRFDGENYNIGFFDVCSRPYEPLCSAAQKSHLALYDIATGKKQPYTNAPDYQLQIFL